MVCDVSQYRITKYMLLGVRVFNNRKTNLVYAHYITFRQRYYTYFNDPFTLTSVWNRLKHKTTMTRRIVINLTQRTYTRYRRLTCTVMRRRHVFTETRQHCRGKKNMLI